MRIKLYFFLLVLSTSSISAQSTCHVPVDIKFTNGEILDAFLCTSWLWSGDEFLEFQRTADSEVTTVPILDVVSVQFVTEDILYERVFYESLKDRRKETKTKTTKFAKVIYDNGIRLLKVRLNITEYNNYAAESKGYLYIIEMGKERVQLDKLDVKMSKGNQLATQRYKGILRYLLQDCNEIATEIRLSSFNDLSLIGLFDFYQECVGTE